MIATWYYQYPQVAADGNIIASDSRLLKLELKLELQLESELGLELELGLAAQG